MIIWGESSTFPSTCRGGTSHFHNLSSFQHHLGFAPFFVAGWEELKDEAFGHRSLSNVCWVRALVEKHDIYIHIHIQFVLLWNRHQRDEGNTLRITRIFFYRQSVRFDEICKGSGKTQWHNTVARSLQTFDAELWYNRMIMYIFESRIKMPAYAAHSY